MHTRRHSRITAIALNIAAILAVLVMALGPVTAMALDRFAPVGESFSINFAPNPTVSEDNGGGEHLKQWIANDASFLYIVNRTLSPNAYEVESALKSNLDALVKSTGCTIVEQYRLQWPKPGGVAQALRFSFRLQTGVLGEGMFVIDGSRGFGAAIADRGQTGRHDSMVDFINSLRILN